jgi:hypothetical protein
MKPKMSLLTDIFDAHHEAMVARERFFDAMELYQAKQTILDRMLWELRGEEKGEELP